MQTITTPAERFILAIWPAREEFPLPRARLGQVQAQLWSARDYADTFDPNRVSEDGSLLHSASEWLLQLDSQARAHHPATVDAP